MADAFGLDDFSYLSGTQQDTARTIQKAFDASTAGRNRALERFNLGTEGPMLTEYTNDAALQRARTTAGILNNNEQLQKMIDYSHRTPHGLAENLSAYLPALGGLSRLYPMLFGTNTGLSQNGLLGSAWNGAKNVVHWLTDPSTGNKIGLDANGNIVTPMQGPGGMDYGMDYENSLNYSNPAFGNDFYTPASSYDWGNYNFDSGLPSDLSWVGADWGF